MAAGTGAVAFATDFQRIWRRVDGWGHILGDRGSSAWVGLQALEAALLTLDGVAVGGEALLAAATEQLGPPDTWPRLAMTRPDAVAVIAGLAPAVTALAASDEVAARICAQAGRELARSLAAAAEGIEGVCLSRTGGLLGAAPVREAFDAEVASLGLEVQPPAGPDWTVRCCWPSTWPPAGSWRSTPHTCRAVDSANLLDTSTRRSPVGTEATLPDSTAADNRDVFRLAPTWMPRCCRPWPSA